MRRKIAGLFRSLSLTTALILVPLASWGQIAVEPPAPIEGQEAKITISGRKAGTEAKLTILPINGSTVGEATVLKESGQEFAHAFQSSGRHLLLADYVKGNNSAGVARMMLRVSETRQDTAEFANSTKLGITYYVWKKIQDNEAKLAVDTQQDGIRGSYLIVAEGFRSQAENAPEVGLSDKPGDKQKVNAFINETFVKIKAELKRKKKWGEGLGDIAEELGQDPAEKAWNDFLDSLHQDLRTDLYVVSGKPSGYEELFTWETAWKEAADAFMNAEKSFTQFIREYKAQNKAVYDSYMNKYQNDDVYSNRYRGPKCPLLIHLGLY